MVNGGGQKYMKSNDVSNHLNKTASSYRVYQILACLAIRKTLLGICSISSSFLVPRSFFTFSWPRWETQEITSHLHDLHSRPRGISKTYTKTKSIFFFEWRQKAILTFPDAGKKSRLRVIFFVIWRRFPDSLRVSIRSLTTSFVFSFWGSVLPQSVNECGLSRLLANNLPTYIWWAKIR